MVEEGVELELRFTTSGGESVEVETDVIGVGLEGLSLASWFSSCGFVSTNATAGPAMSCEVARLLTSLSKGWPSDVSQMMTGPLVSGGMTQSFRGSGVEAVWPPRSI